MKLAETSEFSIDIHPMFETVRIFAGSIGLRCHPETAFSPQMSVWTTAAEKDPSPQDWLTDTLKDNGPVVERTAITLCGMAGEISKIKDRLKDYETEEERDWYRLRALLVSADGATWYHATAMASDIDLPLIETDFIRLLGSIQIKLTGDAANTARETAELEKAAMFDRMKKNMDELSAINRTQQKAFEQAAKAARAKAPVADIEMRFDKAVAAAGLTDKRDALRQIVMPTLSLTEVDVAVPGETGRSRIGGGPDLPANMDWPRDASGFYLNFLVQIDLADLPERPENLPGAGLLFFFSGTDCNDWLVHYTPPGTELMAQALSDDARNSTESAFRMVNWDSNRKQFTANGLSVDGLSVDTDKNGRMTFKRDGLAVRVFASEYEFSRSAQLLRIEHSLSTPFGLPGINNPQVYAESGIEDPSDFALAIQENFQVGDGPQHQMFGITGVRELSSLQALAADYAAKQGWADIAAPDAWFILIKLASGGEADFCFSDYGDYVFMIHRQDAAKGDFSRAFAFVESG
ncbi:DUF1963 domain-containing protein [Bordetella tumbae]|uniref:DUF1963 domain-containing protein n=1 Tax=Bordetella tumbae TaxID=1649139 RepID=UPI0039F0EC64